MSPATDPLPPPSERHALLVSKVADAVKAMEGVELLAESLGYTDIEQTAIQVERILMGCHTIIEMRRPVREVRRAP
jgi:hypothetical protein